MTEEFIKTFVILVTIIDPVGNLPTYMALTEKYTAEDHKALAIKTSFAVFVFLTVSFLAGKYVILFFGIQMSAFKLVGGIFLLYVAFTMITNSKTSYLFSSEELNHKGGISLMPLTFPLLVGPAAISSVIIQSNALIEWSAKIISIMEFVVIGFLIWLTLMLAKKIMGILGKSGIKFLTQIMGLLLGSLAVGFIADELKVLFPGLS
jgi:multiple antibiotic resistance protein